MTKFYQQPFAASGDTGTPIPEAVQPSGSVSYAQGFGPDYAREQGVDPLAKDVPREETNQLFKDITDNLAFWQRQGAPEWVTSAQNGGTPTDGGTGTDGTGGNSSNSLQGFVAVSTDPVEDGDAGSGGDPAVYVQNAVSGFTEFSSGSGGNGGAGGDGARGGTGAAGGVGANLGGCRRDGRECGAGGPGGRGVDA